MKKMYACALFLTVVALPSVADDHCEFSEPREAVLQVDDATELRIDASAGFLHVIGSDDVSEVTVEGTACSARESDLDRIELQTGRRGSSLIVEVDLPDIDWNWNRHVRLDLTLRVPSGLELDIEDGSGEIELSDVGATRVEDGSGEIDIESVNGDLTISDGSGEIEVREVRGSVTVDEDGSGGIRIAGVDGDVDIDEDGSGSISIRDVGGSVRIREDGSGSIRAVEVIGDFIVDRDGSGDISVDRVGGRIELPD